MIKKLFCYLLLGFLAIHILFTPTSANAQAAAQSKAQTKAQTNALPDAGDQPDSFMTAKDVVDDITVGWNLGNDLDCYDELDFGLADLSIENHWGNPAASKELFASVKASGINTVRLPVTWFNHMDPKTKRIDPAWMARVKEVVDEILDEGMYCILNVHHDTGVNGWLTASRANLKSKEETFTAIWEQLCEQFGGYGEKLIFEGYNEILDDKQVWDTPDGDSFDVANELNQLFVDIVRSSGNNNSKRILYIKTYCSSCHTTSLDNFVMPKDPACPDGKDGRIIAGVHIYKPFNFTHENYPDEKSWTESEIDEAMEDTYNRFVANGIPVIIGEFGCADKNNDEQRITWANYFMRTAASYGLKACWWDEGIRYKLFNRYTCRVSEKDLLSAIINGAYGKEYEPQNAVKRTFYGIRDGFETFVLKLLQQPAVKSWWLFAIGVLICIILFNIAAYYYKNAKKKTYPTYDDLYDDAQPFSYRAGLRLLIIISSFFTLMYLLWRVFYSVPVRYGAFAIVANIILLIIEIVGFFETTVHYTNILGTRSHPLPAIDDDEYPEVDIFIATYNESTDLLRLTINGCKHLSYPDKSKVHIWVCDDNRRPQMRSLAESMGVGYFDRPDNKGAKAGNLNHAMGLTHAPYVVTLDADMIVKSDFLMKTMPYFVDAKKRAAEPGKEHIKLGFIQTPQCFYQPDVFQHALYSEHRAPNEQNFFYQTIEPARTCTNSVIYGGSNTIIAREAIEDIGGFYTESITEDFATGLMIESAGYVSLGLSEPLASGQTPNTFKEHIKQRTRWGRGVIVTARKLKLYKRKGLSIPQRLSYWGSVAYWYSPLKSFFYALAPLLFAVFGVVVFNCTFMELLVFWLPSFIIQDVSLWLMSRRAISLKWSGIYETCVMPHMLIPIIKESLGISLTRFNVTEKNAPREGRERNGRLMVPFIVLIIFSIIGIIRVIVGAVGVTAGIRYTAFINAIIILFWLIRNLYFFLMSLFLINGRDSNGEQVEVVDAEPVTLKVGEGAGFNDGGPRTGEGTSIHDGGSRTGENTSTYDGVTSRMTTHNMMVYLDESGLRIGDYVDISLSGMTADAEMSGVVIAKREMRRSQGVVVTVEITDFKEDELEYMQILFDRIPTMPQSLTMRDFGIISHLWHSIYHFKK